MMNKPSDIIIAQYYTMANNYDFMFKFIIIGDSSSFII